MKQRQVYGLFVLLVLMLTGCLDTTKTELTPPSDVVDYGINYSTNAPLTQAKLNNLEQLLAFAKAFEHHHRHQPLYHFWHEEGINLLPADDIPNDLGTCNGSLSKTSEANEAQTQLSNQLQFDNFCNPVLLWNTHSAESGRQLYTGNPDLFSVEYFNYQKNMEGFYKLSVAGLLRVSNGEDGLTYNYDDFLVKQDQPNLEYRYVDFKVTIDNGRAIYTGKIYHPAYGWVMISTGPIGDDRVLTPDNPDQRLNHPIQGKILFKGHDATGILTFNADQTFNLELDLGGNPLNNPKYQSRTWEPELPAYPEPEVTPDYGVKYPANGLINQATLDNMEGLRAFAESFERQHRHQPIVYFWHEEGREQVEGNNSSLPGTCQGELTKTSDLNDDGVRLNKLNFNNYCNPTLLWNTHSAEYGQQVYTGAEDVFLVEYFDYEKVMQAYYGLSIGGKLRVALGESANNLTYNYEDMVVQQSTLNNVERYEDFLVTFTETGAIYNGKIYHSAYGWAEISTGGALGSRVVTAEDENQRLNRPIAGRIQIKGRVGTGTLTFNSNQSYNLELDLGGDPADNPAALTNQAWPN